MARASKGAGTPEDHESVSTLAQIREKELEFDGLVMVARSDAEMRLQEAQSQAEESFARAEAKAERLTTEAESQIVAAAKSEADGLRAAARDQIEQMREVAEARRRAMVDEIVRATLGS